MRIGPQAKLGRTRRVFAFEQRQGAGAAADVIAELAKDGELVPNALDKHVHEAVAEAVKDAAERSGIARPERANTEL